MILYRIIKLSWTTEGGEYWIEEMFYGFLIRKYLIFFSQRLLIKTCVYVNKTTLAPACIKRKANINITNSLISSSSYNSSKVISHHDQLITILWYVIWWLISSHILHTHSIYHMWTYHSLYTIYLLTRRMKKFWNILVLTARLQWRQILYIYMKLNEMTTTGGLFLLHF